MVAYLQNALRQSGGPGSKKSYVAAAGAVQGQTLQANGTYTVGTACTTGSLGRSATGMLVCLNSVWRTLITQAAAGDACVQNGSSAVTAANVELVCQGGVYTGLDTLFPSATTNAACTASGKFGYDTSQRVHVCRANPNDSSATLRWMRINDLVGNLVFVSATEVTHLAKVVKPTCSGASAVPLMQMIGKIEATSDGGFGRYASDIVEGGVAKWQVYLTNGSGGSLTSASGSATAVAQVFCYTP